MSPFEQYHGKERKYINGSNRETGNYSGNEQGFGYADQRLRALFICTHNSARSQMAERYLRARYGNQFEALSTGTEGRKIHPLAIAVMEKIGIDISRHRSKLIDEFFGTGIDVAGTACDAAHRSCPFFPGAKDAIHAGFPDLSSCTGSPDECIAQFHEVRDAIPVRRDTTVVPEYVPRSTLSRTGRILAFKHIVTM